MTQRLSNMVLIQRQCRMHPASPRTLFFHIFSLAREKIWPAEQRQGCKFATQYRRVDVGIDPYGCGGDLEKALSGGCAASSPRGRAKTGCAVNRWESQGRGEAAPGAEKNCRMQQRTNPPVKPAGSFFIGSNDCWVGFRVSRRGGGAWRRVGRGWRSAAAGVCRIPVPLRRT